MSTNLSNTSIMNTSVHLDRVIFNFTKRCNLSCEFCYVPFDGKHSELETWQRIIERCKQFKPKIITFAGGDPFIYKDFPKLLEFTSEKNLFIQIDTNTLGLRIEHLPTIKQTTQLVGLPMDGTEQTHGVVRGNPRHFKVVLDWIRKLTDEGVVVKVNTIVTKVNVFDLDNLARLLSNFPISRWSLYQFWPLGPGKQYREKFEISTADFTEATTELQKRYNFTRIEPSSINNRTLGYFFVSNIGRVYVMDRHNHEEYVELGSIFDEDIVNKWQQHGDSQALTSRATLRTSVALDSVSIVKDQ